MTSPAAPVSLRQQLSRLFLPLVAFCMTALLSACTPAGTLMPTPAIYEGPGARPIFAGALAANPPRSLDLLYVTDRAPIIGPDGQLSYGTERSRVMSFGSLSLGIDEDGKADGGRFRLGTPRQIGAFPRIPYGIRKVPGGFSRDTAAVAGHEAAVRGLQAEVARRLARAPRKEVVIFIHGYANTFEDAAYSTGNICRFLGAEFVCVVLTWPAGGSSGILFGYNVDRESGEFAVTDLKKAIRAIGETSGVARMHIIAYSRGTDITASALQQLGIETYATKSSLSQRLKISNVVLASPDIDLDVAASKIMSIGSDPNLPFGATPRPAGVFPQGDFHLTVYSSPNDKALALSDLIFGGILRLGQLDASSRATGTLAEMRPPEVAGLVDFIEFKGSNGFIGHDYFLSDTQVSADIVGLIRYRIKAGEPGRPLIEIKRPFWRIADERSR